MFNQRSRSQIRDHLNSVLNNEAANVEDPAEDENQTPEQTQESEEDISDNETDENEASQNVDDRRPPSRTRDPFERGTTVVEEPDFRVKVKSVHHIRRNQYELIDHLYSIWIEQKSRRTAPPLLLDLEEALESALIHVLDELKSVYSNRHYQIYVTVIDRSIKSGLNSGNYSIQTPSPKIARWMMAMLYNYLKSNQTMRLNRSFKVQIKVLSVHHTRNLQQNRRNFRPHVYH